MSLHFEFPVPFAKKKKKKERLMHLFLPLMHEKKGRKLNFSRARERDSQLKNINMANRGRKFKSLPACTLFVLLMSFRRFINHEKRRRKKILSLSLCALFSPLYLTLIEPVLLYFVNFTSRDCVYACTFTTTTATATVSRYSPLQENKLQDSNSCTGQNNESPH